MLIVHSGPMKLEEDSVHAVGIVFIPTFFPLFFFTPREYFMQATKQVRSTLA
jgi:hypothetical protein